MYRLTNLFFTTGDALCNIWFDGNLIWIARWSSAWLSSLSTDLTMPYINGMIVLFAVAILSALLVELLEIRSALMAVLVGGVLMCFPTVSDTLGYLHNADAYMLAAMLSVLGFFVLERFRWGMIPAVALITLGTGTYQACATLVIGLMFVRGVQLLVDTEETAKVLWLRAIKWIVCMAVSIALYYVLAQVFSSHSGIAIGSYQSVTEKASLATLQLIPQNFLMCYQDFAAQLAWQPDGPLTLVGWLNILIVAATVLLTLVMFAAKQRKNLFRWLTLLLLIVFAPFFLCSIRLFNPDTVYSLMRYSVAGVYLWALWMIDRLPEIFDRKKRMCLPACAAGWVTVLCTTLCIFQWTVSANYSFYQATLDYEKMYAQCVKFIDMAESHEDYMGGMPILVIGDMANNEMRSVPALNQTKYYSSFMESILGVNAPYGTANEVRESLWIRPISLRCPAIPLKTACR